MMSERTRAVIQRAVERSLTDTCKIEVMVKGRGVYGEPLADSWELVAENVKCRVIRSGSRSSSASEQVGNQETIREMYRLIVPRGTALDIDQRVTVNGLVYQIVDVVTAWTDAVDAQAIMVRARGAS
jgi:hypothetical protein